MKFCTACQNMLYLRLEEGSMQYHCKNCTLTVTANDAEDSASTPTSTPAPTSTPTSTCVIDNNYMDDFHKQYITPYIAHDPTLPRTHTINCINETCGRPASKPQEVIYVKYDPVNLKYLYCCCHCGTFWKTRS